jgi:predicted nucleic acid-binding protein
MTIVFDASALIAYPRGEPGAEVVEAHLASDGSELYVHALNLCEVYYDFLRASDEESAEAAVTDILTLGICERNDMSPEFWRSAGKLKAKHRRVSLADCCALALTIHVGATLVTADRHELEPLSNESVCPVEFIR